MGGYYQPELLDQTECHAMRTKPLELASVAGMLVLILLIIPLGLLVLILGPPERDERREGPR